MSCGSKQNTGFVIFPSENEVGFVFCDLRYPPLVDVHGSFTAQYEHTIVVGQKSKEVLTRGSDF